MTIQLPVLVLGRADAPVLLRHGVGYVDDDQPFDLVSRTDPYLPAGIPGEAIFYTVYLTTTHFEAVTVLRVTARVDGVAVKTTDVVLNTSPSDDGEQRVHEIDLSQAYVVGGVEKLRYYPRGTWLDVTVETVRGQGLGVGARQIVDGVECEFEIVQEGKEPVT